jgi:hypothetical protein
VPFDDVIPVGTATTGFTVTTTLLLADVVSLIQLVEVPLQLAVYVVVVVGLTVTGEPVAATAAPIYHTAVLPEAQVLVKVVLAPTHIAVEPAEDTLLVGGAIIGCTVTVILFEDVNNATQFVSTLHTKPYVVVEVGF